VWSRSRREKRLKGFGGAVEEEVVVVERRVDV